MRRAPSARPGGIAVLLALGQRAAWSGKLGDGPPLRQRRRLGAVDPTFGRDIGFYVFDLPFWRFLLGWATTALIVIGLLTLGLRRAGAALAVPPDAPGPGPPVGHRRAAARRRRRRLPARHRRAGVLDRRLNDSVQAALYTDMNAQLPAYQILTVVALVAAALLLLNTWFRTLWALAWPAGVVRAVDRGRRALPDVRAELPGQPERAERRAAVHRRPHRPPRGPPSTSTRSSCATSPASRT